MQSHSLSWALLRSYQFCSGSRSRPLVRSIPSPTSCQSRSLERCLGVLPEDSTKSSSLSIFVLLILRISCIICGLLFLPEIAPFTLGRRGFFRDTGQLLPVSRNCLLAAFKLRSLIHSDAVPMIGIW